MEAAAEVMEAADTAVNLNKTKSNTPLQATGYLTLAAVAKCLQAATWLVFAGIKNTSYDGRKCFALYKSAPVI